MEKKNTASNLDLLNKDRIWVKIKKYIYLIIFLIIFLIVLLIMCVILNISVFVKLKNHANYISPLGD